MGPEPYNLCGFTGEVWSKNTGESPGLLYSLVIVACNSKPLNAARRDFSTLKSCKSLFALQAPAIKS